MGEIPWRRKWHTTQVFLPGNFHGQRSLVGYSPWVHKESDPTEWLSTHTGTESRRAYLLHCEPMSSVFHVVVLSVSRVWLFANPWTAPCQSSLSFTVSWSLFKFMPIELVMASNHLLLCLSLLLLLLPWIFPSIRVFSNELALRIRCPKYWASPSASVLPMSIPGWFPLGLISLIALQSKGLSRVFSSTTVQKHQFFDTQPSLWSNAHIRTWLLEKPWLLLMWSTGYGHDKPLQYPYLENPKKVWKGKKIWLQKMSPLGW